MIPERVPVPLPNLIPPEPLSPGQGRAGPSRAAPSSVGLAARVGVEPSSPAKMLQDITSLGNEIMAVLDASSKSTPTSITDRGSKKSSLESLIQQYEEKLNKLIKHHEGGSGRPMALGYVEARQKELAGFKGRLAEQSSSKPAALAAAAVTYTRVERGVKGLDAPPPPPPPEDEIPPPPDEAPPPLPDEKDFDKFTLPPPPPRPPARMPPPIPARPRIPPPPPPPPPPAPAPPTRIPPPAPPSTPPPPAPPSTPPPPATHTIPPPPSTPPPPDHRRSPARLESFLSSASPPASPTSPAAPAAARGAAAGGGPAPHIKTKDPLKIKDPLDLMQERFTKMREELEALHKSHGPLNALKRELAKVQAQLAPQRQSPAPTKTKKSPEVQELEAQEAALKVNIQKLEEPAMKILPALMVQRGALAKLRDEFQEKMRQLEKEIQTAGNPDKIKVSLQQLKNLAAQAFDIDARYFFALGHSNILQGKAPGPFLVETDVKKKIAGLEQQLIQKGKDALINALVEPLKSRVPSSPDEMPAFLAGVKKEFSELTTALRELGASDEQITAAQKKVLAELADKMIELSTQPLKDGFKNDLGRSETRSKVMEDYLLARQEHVRRLLEPLRALGLSEAQLQERVAEDGKTEKASIEKEAQDYLNGMANERRSDLVADKEISPKQLTDHLAYIESEVRAMRRSLGSLENIDKAVTDALAKERREIRDAVIEKKLGGERARLNKAIKDLTPGAVSGVKRELDTYLENLRVLSNKVGKDLGIPEEVVGREFEYRAREFRKSLSERQQVSGFR